MDKKKEFLLEEEKLKEYIRQLLKETMEEEKQSKCELVICEDPITGDFVVKPKGKCPEGYIERAKEGIKTKGLVFPKKVKED